MKVKTSITLSENLIAEMDNLAGEFQSRSSFLEQAAWAYIAELKRQELAARDLAILDANADRLNEEIADALDYQVPA